MVTRSKSREFEQEVAVGVREEVSSFLKSEEFRKIVQSAVAETLKACIDQHVQPLQVEVSGLKDAIVRVEDELIEAKQLLNEKVVVLQNVIVNLEEKVARLATKANDNEQYSRRYNIRVSGFPEESDENCSLKVGQLCRETLLLPDFSEEQIDRIHRVGKPRSDGKSRAIIVRFKSHKYKLNVLQAKNKLRNSPFSINEDLTRQNQQLFYTARTGCTNVSSAWTIDGRIFAKRQSDDRKFNIVRYTDFEEYDLM